MKIKLFILYLVIVTLNYCSSEKNSNIEKQQVKQEVEKKNDVEEETLEEKQVIKEPEKDLRGTYKKIELSNLSEIQSIKNRREVPRIVYSVDKISLKGLSISKKKELFLEIMVPTAMIAIEEVELEREKVKKMMDNKTEQDKKYLSELYKKYRVEDKNIKTLYNKMKPAPISVLLSQATLESAWGTSRIFEEANNIFGVWSVDPNEPRIKAGRARAHKQVYLKKYPTLKESIDDYLHLLARHKAYSGFREKLQKTNDYKVLIPKLDKYSEMGKVYTDRLLKTVSYNKLYEYDSYEFK